MASSASKTPGPYLSARAAARGKRPPLPTAAHPPSIIVTSASEEQGTASSSSISHCFEHKQNARQTVNVEPSSLDPSKSTPSDLSAIDNENDTADMTSSFLDEVLTNFRRMKLENTTLSDQPKSGVGKSSVKEIDQKNENKQINASRSSDTVVVRSKVQPKTYVFDDEPPKLSHDPQSWAWLDTEVVPDPSGNGKFIVLQKTPKSDEKTKPVDSEDTVNLINQDQPSPSNPEDSRPNTLPRAGIGYSTSQQAATSKTSVPLDAHVVTSEFTQEGMLKQISIPPGVSNAKAGVSASAPPLSELPFKGNLTTAKPLRKAVEKDVNKSREGGRKAVAQYDFTANESNQLSFRKGDRFSNVKVVDLNWVVGSHESGRTGLIPKNKVLPEKKANNEHDLTNGNASKEPAPATSSKNQGKQQPQASQPDLQQPALSKMTLVGPEGSPTTLTVHSKNAKPDTAVISDRLDPPNDPNQTRSVILEGLPDKATLTLVCSLVAGHGKVASIILDLSKAKAHLSFVDPAAAGQLVSSNLDGIKFKFHGTPYTTTIFLDDVAEPISPILQAQLDCGATRCVRAVRVKADLDVRVITGAAERYGGGEAEYVGYEAMGQGRCVVLWRWASIEQAVIFKKGLEQDGDFTKCPVFFCPDPCEGKIGRRGMGRVERSG